MNLKVHAKVQKAGTDFTIRPHLDLPWEWGGGEYEEALNAARITTVHHPSIASNDLLKTHQHLSSLPSIFENVHEAENYTTARVHLDLLEYGGAGY